MPNVMCGSCKAALTENGKKCPLQAWIRCSYFNKMKQQEKFRKHGIDHSNIRFLKSAEKLKEKLTDIRFVHSYDYTAAIEFLNSPSD